MLLIIPNVFTQVDWSPVLLPIHRVATVREKRGEMTNETLNQTDNTGRIAGRRDAGCCR